MPKDASSDLRRQKDCILLTGATGLVGQYVMIEFLTSGKPLAVMARANRLVSARQRIEATLRLWEHRLGRLLPRPKVIEGNLREDNCGISYTDTRWIQRYVSSILHSGASVRFLLDESSNEPFASNVNGTIQLINLARRSDVSAFHLISTAYVAGDRCGTILENELDVGQRFNNPYENSKFQSESYVRENVHNFDSVNIFRPSIVAGDSRDGFTTTFHTFYSALRFARCLPDRDTEDIDSLFQQLGLSSLESKNIVHVDWLAKTIANLICRPIRDTTADSVDTFHLTHPQPTTTRQISDAMNMAIASERQHWDALAGQFPRIDFETAAATAFESFDGYLTDDPVFDQRNLKSALGEITPPEINAESLAKLFRFAIRNGLQPIRPRVQPRLKRDYRDVLDSDALQREDLLKDEASTTTEPVQQFTSQLDHSNETSQIQLHLRGPGGGSWSVHFDPSDSDPQVRYAGNLGCRFQEIPSAFIATEAPADFVTIFTTLATLKKSQTREQIAQHLADGTILIFVGAGNHKNLISTIEFIAEHIRLACKHEIGPALNQNLNDATDPSLQHIVQDDQPDSGRIAKPQH